MSKAVCQGVFLTAAAVLAMAGSLAAADSKLPDVSPSAGWPEFRGPTGDGHAAVEADSSLLPLKWSETENVRWKTAIPHRGWSTPVVLDGRVWLTTASLDGHDFYAICLDAETGKVLHEVPVFHTDSPESLGNNVNSYASPSPAVEHGRVYVHFGSYATACLDVATGAEIWKRTDLPCRHYRGPGSSIILVGGLLILTFDGVDTQYVAGLDKATGKTVWRTGRSTEWDDLDSNGVPQREGDFRKAYSTPLAVTVSGAAQIVSVGSKAAFLYDAATGKELWRLPLSSYSAAARPVAGGGLAYVMIGQGKPELWALRLDASIAPANRVAWKFTQDASKMPSPILVDDLLYVCGDGGTVTCLRAATGAPVWKEKIGGNYAASPVYAGGRLYFCSQQGKTTVMAPGRTSQILATNILDGGFMASPAVCGKALFLRTKTHLYRIESSPATK